MKKKVCAIFFILIFSSILAVGGYFGYLYLKKEDKLPSFLNFDDKCKISYSKSNGYEIIPVEGDFNVDKNSNFRFKIKSKNGYVLDYIKINVNGQELVPDDNGIYSIKNISTDLLISINNVIVSPSKENFKYIINSNGTATLKELSSKNSNIVLPREVDGHKFTKIANGALKNTNYTNIIIPDTYKEVGNNAFFQMKYLERVYIPNSLETIKNQAFMYCESLTYVDSGDDLKLSNIGDNAFYGCNLKKIFLPNSIKDLGDKVFSKNNNLISLTVDNIHIKDTKYFFADCINLENVIITGDLPLGIFDNCTNLKNVTLKSNKSIGEGAFKNCINLERIENDNTDNIDKESFLNCEKLAYFNFQNVVNIKDNAFENCESLEIIDLPNCLKIGKKSFYLCKNINHLSFDKILEIDDEAFLQDKKDTINKIDILKIPETLTKIGENVFGENNGLVEVNYLANISNYSLFRNCYNLQQISIPNLTRVEDYMFENCKALENVTNIDNVEYIDDFAFNNCKKLNNCTFTKLISVGNYSFSLCQSLNSFTFPNSTTILGKKAFYNCENLADITLSNNLQTINDNCFEDCIMLATVNNISDTIQNVGKYILENTKWIKNTSGENVISNDFGKFIVFGSILLKYEGNVENVEVPEVITQVNSYSFKDSTVLKKVTLPSTIIKLYQFSFFNCDNLTTLNINSENPPIIENNSLDLDYLKAIIINDDYCENFVNTDTSGWSDEIKKIIYSDSLNITDNFIFDMSGETKVLKKYTGNDVNVKIPYGINKIGENAFINTDIETVSFPTSLTTIGEKAFYNCNSLSNIVIPSSVITIDEMAFGICDSLRTITFENGSKIYEIKDYAFAGYLVDEEVGNSNLINDINLPSNLNYLGKGVFSGCKSLNSINICDNINQLNSYLFYGCTNLATVVCNNEITDIGDFTFYKCENIDNFVLSNDILNIGNYAFANSAITFTQTPYDLESVKNYAFYNCKNLNNITFNFEVASIGNFAFSNCQNLKTVSLPNALTSLGESCFENCDLLTNVVFKDNLTIVSKRAFADCGKLQSVDLPVNITTIEDEAFLNSAVNEVNFEDLVNLENIKQSAFDNCKFENITFNEALQIIGVEAFANNELLSQVNLSNVTELSSKSFYNSGLSAVTLPSSLNTIGESVFEFNNNLETVTFADNINLKTLSNKMFFKCSNLRMIEIPNSIEKIESFCFALNTNLHSLTFAENSKLKSIDEYAFSGFVNENDAVVGNGNMLTTLSFPNSLKTLGEGVFYRNSNLSEVNQSSVTNYGDYCFEKCGNLATFDFSSKIESVGIKCFNENNLTGDYSLDIVNIGESAFSSNPNLTKISLGVFVETIANDAFRNLESIKEYEVNSANENYSNQDGILYNKTKNRLLYYPTSKYISSLTLPNNVSFIERGAFENATELMEINFNDNLTNIGDKAFYGCINLLKITIPENVVEIGEEVFSYCKSLNSIIFESANPPVIVSDFIENSNVKTIFVSQENYNNYKNSADENWNDSLKELIYSLDNLINDMLVIDNELVCYLGNKENITIPSQVVRIKERAYINKNIVNVDGGENVEFIGNDAFKGTQWLTNLNLSINKLGKVILSYDNSLDINIEEGITQIYDSAFKGHKINSIQLPNSLKYIGKYSFESVINLKQITIPANVEKIDFGAFMNMHNLKEIYFDCTEKPIIRNYAFDNCNCLIGGFVNDELVESFNDVSIKIYSKNVINGDFVVDVNGKLIDYLGNANKLTVPNQIQINGENVVIREIEANAFSNSNISILKLPETLTVINTDSLNNIKKLNTIILTSDVPPNIGDNYYLPSSLTAILVKNKNYYTANDTWQAYNSKLFENNDAEFIINNNKLVSYVGNSSNVVIPNEISLNGENVAVNQISANAFKGNDSVQTIKINSNVNFIDKTAFESCENLISFEVDANNTHFASDNGILFNKNLTKLIKYPTNKAGVTYTTPQNLLEIGENSFRDNKNIVTLYLQNDLNIIDNNAFKGCLSLREINIGSSLDKINKNAFSDCLSLTTVNFDTGISSIGNGAFENCISLENISLPNSLISLGSNAFRNCISLINVSIENSLNSIGDYAFFNCYKLTNLNINSSKIIYIGEQILKYQNNSLIILDNLSINVSSEMINLYKTDDKWQEYADYVNTL